MSDRASLQALCPAEHPNQRRVGAGRPRGRALRILHDSIVGPHEDDEQCHSFRQAKCSSAAAAALPTHTRRPCAVGWVTKGAGTKRSAGQPGQVTEEGASPAPAETGGFR